MLTKDTVLLSLDVEAPFLYEPACSYGYVLGDIYGNVIEEDYQFSSSSLYLDELKQSEKYFNWFKENVLSVAGVFTNEKYYIGQLFYKKWTELKDKYNDNIVIIADCPFPCESKFLERVISWHSEWYVEYQNVTEKYDNQFKYSPYPVLDLASILISHNLSTTFERLPNELPLHHPLNDARQTYRKFIELVADNLIKVNGVN